MQFHNPFISHGGEDLVLLDSQYSLMFDGINDSLNLSDALKTFQYTNSELNSHGVTMNCWIKFDAISGSEPLFCVGRNHNRYYGYGFQIGNNQKAQIHKYGLNSGNSGQGSNNRLTRQTTTTLSTGVWYMLTFVMGDGDRSDWRMYFNGVEQSASNSGNTGVTLSYNNTTNVLIGRSGRTSAERYHSGNISSFFVWEDALVTEQIQSLYNNGDGLNPLFDSSYTQNGGATAVSNLKACLLLENSLLDETNNNHDGTVSGAVFETDVP